MAHNNNQQSWAIKVLLIMNWNDGSCTTCWSLTTSTVSTTYNYTTGRVTNMVQVVIIWPQKLHTGRKTNKRTSERGKRWRVRAVYSINKTLLLSLRLWFSVRPPLLQIYLKGNHLMLHQIKAWTKCHNYVPTLWREEETDFSLLTRLFCDNNKKIAFNSRLLSPEMLVLQRI